MRATLPQPQTNATLSGIALSAAGSTEQYLASVLNRDRPHCEKPMPREASVCPHCQRDSTPWTLHEGRWWVSLDGEWHWLDEENWGWHPVE
jgi:hypothetical protein